MKRNRSPRRLQGTVRVKKTERVTNSLFLEGEFLMPIRFEQHNRMCFVIEHPARPVVQMRCWTENHRLFRTLLRIADGQRVFVQGALQVSPHSLQVEIQVLHIETVNTSS